MSTESKASTPEAPERYTPAKKTAKKGLRYMHGNASSLPLYHSTKNSLSGVFRFFNSLIILAHRTNSRYDVLERCPQQNLKQA